MPQLSPYINFGGQCRTAMNFYKECLGGELMIQDIADSPIADQMCAEAQQGVMHSSLTSGNIMLLASDMSGAEMVKGNNISLMINADSIEQANELFGKLAEGGEVNMPVSPMFWGGHFGSLTDKFGITWLLHYMEEQG